MHDREHPTPTLLTRFARGAVTKDETRVVVRHLLAGCPHCTAILRPTVKRAERIALRRAPQPQLARQQRG